MRYLPLLAAMLLLPAAAVAQPAAATQAAEASPTTMDEDMTVLAERAVRVTAANGVTLDYSPESIELVEQRLGKLHDAFRKLQDEPSGKLASPSDYEIRLMSLTYGAYIAEVLKRKHGEGTWSYESRLYAGQEVPTFHVGANRIEMWPQIKVEKRLRNGPEDNVWHYFQLPLQKLGAK
ncbi:hypothetical protein ABL840_35185 [Variovorax sp. NFACC27]|uniref:hypothetical protein n=1 Tax=unclassified Variovorax TaxID=663243 RepID=UPI00089506C3|nr:hypothetical protein SAMN03159371_06302 [Variovorax sp. NFACC28]SEG95861.1 hypothetical protein SAMN03159365_06380 [Variovorax sp. NFACC29]SFD80108.1 hypothetical protein SAMN03159379_06339 [Variovorax sp. NFACC26]SFG93293.1 hypothetical protein SAMN03159447_05682 [Variovorax sp. NFACC27]